MKKIIFLFLFSFILFAALGDNVVSNSTFDANITGWSVSQVPATHEWVESGGGFTGALHIVGDSQYDGTQQKNLAVDGTSSYQFSGDIYLTAISAGSNIRFCCYNVTDSYIGIYELKGGINSPGSYSFCDTITPTVANNTRIWIIETTITAGYEIYVDNIYLKKIVADPATADPATDEEPGFGGYLNRRGFGGW